jgi:hypothetical protein
MQKSYNRQTNITDISYVDTVETDIIDINIIQADTVEMDIIDINIIQADTECTLHSFKRHVWIRPSSHVLNRLKQIKLLDMICVLLLLLAFFLWAISLQQVSIKDMNDLGLISVLSPNIIAGLCILIVSFTLTLQRQEFRISLLALHLICIIVILYGTPNLIEGVLHFDVIYKHAGYTEYIMRTGTVDPYLDTYFNWPGFFVLSALTTKLSGYSTILSYAGWAPVFFNIIYLGPMYIIFTSITTNRRLIWLSLLFFYITNWIGQDYFSPQGLNFFLYLVIMAIILKWFKKNPKAKSSSQFRQTNRQHLSVRRGFIEWLEAPDPFVTTIQPWQRRGLLCYLIFIFGLIVYSHPLTPFFTLVSIMLLIAFRRCYPFWLPILTAFLTAAWIFIMARPFLTEHVNMIVSNLGDLMGNVPKSITSGSFGESHLYQVVAKMRLFMTFLIWFLAFLGGLKRLRQGYRDITYILLATAGFSLIIAQSYGGEMLLRIYLFTLPFLVLFAANLFCSKPTLMKRTTSPWRTVLIIVINLILLGGFFFTRYGDERVYYFTNDEWKAAQYLYEIAPSNSLFLEAWNNTPLQYENYEKYNIQSLTDLNPNAVIHTKANSVIQYLKSVRASKSYIIFTQGEQAQASAWSGLPSDILNRLEERLLQSGKFRIIYSNSNAQILQFIR